MVTSPRLLAMSTVASRGHEDVHVGFHAVIACPVGIGVQQHRAAGDRDLRLGAVVVLVGVVLVLRVQLLVDDHAQRVVVGGRDVQAAMIADHAQAAFGRKRLLQRVVKGVRGTEHAAQIVVHLNLIAHPSPINIGAVMRRQSDSDDQDQQQHAARAQCRWCGNPGAAPMECSISRITPQQNEQQRPPVSKPVPDGKPHSKVPQQEYQADDDQHQRSGNRAAVTIRWRHAGAVQLAEADIAFGLAIVHLRIIRTVPICIRRDRSLPAERRRRHHWGLLRRTGERRRCPRPSPAVMAPYSRGT